MRILGGKYKGQEVLSPKGERTRPTTGLVRQAFFNILQHEIEGASFLDLFAGSGAMGFEALSHEASHVVFVESDKGCAKRILESAKRLSILSQVRVMEEDVMEALRKLSKRELAFDVIFADPPYDQGWGSRVVLEVERRALLREGGRLFIEEGKSFSGEELVLERLVCKSKRVYGNSVLWEFG